MSNFLKHSILLATICGVAFTSLIVLALNVAFFPAIFLAPGGVLGSLLVRSDGLGSVPFVLGANAIFYSAIFFSVLFLTKHSINVDSVRLLAVRLAIPTAALALIACTPRLSPVWPRGMVDLAKTEAGLQAAILPDMTLEQARTVLQSRGIEFEEEEEKSPVVVLQNADTTIQATTGDRLLTSRVHTNAEQFPCNYEVRILLLFGQDGRLQQRYVRRRSICP